MRNEPAFLNVEELAANLRCHPNAIERLVDFGRLNPHGPRQFLGIKLPLFFLVRPADLPEIRARLEAMRHEQDAGILPR
jgi:hypothetical protein